MTLVGSASKSLSFSRHARLRGKEATAFAEKLGKRAKSRKPLLVFGSAEAFSRGAKKSSGR
jgi:hypothetical protein